MLSPFWSVASESPGKQFFEFGPESVVTPCVTPSSPGGVGDAEVPPEEENRLGNADLQTSSVVAVPNVAGVLSVLPLQAHPEPA